MSYIKSIGTKPLLFHTSAIERLRIAQDGKVTIPNQLIVPGGINIQWTTGKSYSVDDIVLKDGYLIRCLTNHTSGTYATDVSTGKWQLATPAKNYLINGNFDIWQRGTSFANGLVYGADRWTAMNSQVRTFTRQPWTSGGTHPGGSQYVLRAAGDGVSSTWASNGQGVELLNTIPLRGKTITASGYVRFSAASWSVTPVACVLVLGYTTTTADANIHSTDYNISGSVATTFAQGSLPTVWTKVVLTLSIPTNANNIAIIQSGTINTFGAGDYMEWSQWIINEGPAPALFQTAGVNITDELTICQRYYERRTLAAGNSWGWFSIIAQSTTYAEGTWEFKVPKRISITPTLVGAHSWINPIVPHTAPAPSETLSAGTIASRIAFSSSGMTLGFYNLQGIGGTAELVGDAEL